MFDLNSLKVFVTLYKSGSTQKAALKLGRSQSYVSKTLATLRDELGDPLFVRTSSGLHPTSYANQIAPKIQAAIEQLSLALEPEVFEPQRLQSVTLHITEPLLVTLGKPILDALRDETSAIIDIRHWDNNSSQKLLDGKVDLGIQAVKDRPQQFYQRKIGTTYAKMIGNRQGEYIKLMINDFNEHLNLYKNFDKEITPSIFIDNYMLLNELLDKHYTFRVQLTQDKDCFETGVDIATICDATKRYEAKTIWLSSICQRVIDQAIRTP